MKTSIHIASLLLVCFVFLFSSCDKKVLCRFPHPHDARICHTSINVSFNSKWSNDTIYSVNTYADVPVTPKLRYVMEFWTLDVDNNLAKRIDKQVYTGFNLKDGDNTATLNIDLPAQRVAILAWAEPLFNGETANSNFNTDSLSKVKLVEPYPCAGTKDAFTASKIIDLTSYIYDKDGISVSETMTLVRPFGKYQIITNDLLEYQEKEGPHAPMPSATKAAYQLWTSNIFNVYLQKAMGSVKGVSYTNHVLKIEGKTDEMLLASDYLFISESSADIFSNLQCTVNAEDGVMIHESGTIGIRMQRNKLTIVKGAFLTTRKTNSPGVDDGFDHEIIWPVN